MNITYVAPPRSGTVLTAEAREVSLTRKTAGYDIKVCDEAGGLIAYCSALVYRKGSPLPFLEETADEKTG